MLVQAPGLHSDPDSSMVVPTFSQTEGVNKRKL